MLIAYKSGAELLALSEAWYDQVYAITQKEPQLLVKTRKELEPAAKAGHVLLAIDLENDAHVVGAIVLWDLTTDHRGQMWYELGTFFVRQDYRFAITGLPIGDTLYARLLEENVGKNILGTTGNIHAIHTGARHGMQMIRFGDLPESIRRSTCVCPAKKTGTMDNQHCQLKDQGCFVRVSCDTWERLDRPTRFSLSPTRTPAFC